MTARIGAQQLDLLAKMACPHMSLVVGDKLARSLAKRGLLRPLGKDSFFVITPAGLRTVADAIEAGRVKQEITALPADRRA